MLIGVYLPLIKQIKTENYDQLFTFRRYRNYIFFRIVDKVIGFEKVSVMLFCQQSWTSSAIFRKTRLKIAFAINVPSIYLNAPILTNIGKLAIYILFAVRLLMEIHSSSCRAASTEIPDPLSPLLPIVHRLWQVFRATSRILT